MSLLGSFSFSFSLTSNWSEARKKDLTDYFLMVLLLGNHKYRGQFNPRKFGKSPCQQSRKVQQVQNEGTFQRLLGETTLQWFIVLKKQTENSGCSLFAWSFNIRQIGDQAELRKSILIFQGRQAKDSVLSGCHWGPYVSHVELICGFHTERNS